MKKIIAFLMAVLLLFSIALAEDVVLGRQEGIEWGMSVDQVQEIVGSDYQTADQEYMSMLSKESVSIYGADADIAYLFYFGKLVAMGYNVDLNEADVDALFEALAAVYGPPKALDMGRLNGITSRLNPEFTVGEVEERLNCSFQADDGTYIVWLVEGSTLELMFFAENLIAEIYDSEGKDVVMAYQDDSTFELSESEQEGNDTFRITFQFHNDSRDIDRNNHADDDLRRVNDVLSGLALSGISIENDRGYLVTNTSYDGNEQPTSVEYQYGLLELTLVCKQEEGKRLDQYQMDVVVDADGIYNSETFHHFWCNQNPDRLVRVIQCHSGVWKDELSNGSIYIVLSTER